MDSQISIEIVSFHSWIELNIYEAIASVDTYMLFVYFNSHL